MEQGRATDVPLASSGCLISVGDGMREGSLGGRLKWEYQVLMALASGSGADGRLQRPQRFCVLVLQNQEEQDCSRRAVGREDPS